MTKFPKRDVAGLRSRPTGLLPDTRKPRTTGISSSASLNLACSNSAQGTPAFWPNASRTANGNPTKCRSSESGITGGLCGQVLRFGSEIEGLGQRLGDRGEVGAMDLAAIIIVGACPEEA